MLALMLILVRIPNVTATDNQLMASGARSVVTAASVGI